MANTRDPAPKLVIFIRFSFVGRGDWLRWRKPGVASRDLDQVAAELFSDARLMHRFRAFEMLTLDGLMSQTDRDFTTIVLTSPQMPARYLDRLHKLCDRLPGAEVLVSDATGVETALSPVVWELERHSAHLLQIRLDDDDALSVNFIARMRSCATRMQAFPVYAISFPRGLSLHNWADRPIALNEMRRPFIGIGVAARMPEGLTIFRHSHGGLPLHYPALQDGAEVNFIHHRWSWSDTASGPEVLHQAEQEIDPLDLVTTIEQEFPFLLGKDLAALRQWEGMPAADRPAPRPAAD